MTVSQATVNNYLKQYGYSQPTTTAPFQQTANVPQVFAGQQMQQAEQVYPPVPTSSDGCDDGKISFGKKAKNFGKGCLKFVTGMFTGKDGKFSLKQTLKSVGIMAAGVALSWCTGGSSLALAAVAVGVVSGGVKVAQGAIKASKATTDAEAEAAWQDIGLGATTVGVSIAGAKSAMAKSSGGTFKGGALKATKQCFVETGKNALSAGKSIKGSFASKTLGKDALELFNTGKANFNANVQANFGSGKALTNFQEKAISNIDKKIAKLDPTQDADLISKLTTQKESLISDFGHIKNATSTDDIASIIKTYEDKLQTLQTAGAGSEEIAVMQQQIKTLQTAGSIQTGHIKNLVAQTEQQVGKIAKLTEKIENLDPVKDIKKIAELTTQKEGLINQYNANKNTLSLFDITQLDKITAQEAKILLKNQYITPLQKPVITQIKYNPLIGRNITEAPQGLTAEQFAQLQAAQAQQFNSNNQMGLPNFTSSDYTMEYFNQFRNNNSFNA